MKLLPSSFKKLTSVLRSGAHPHPVRDWFMLLGLSIALLGVSAAWNVWSYAQAGSLGEPNASAANKPKFDRAAIEAVRTSFELRASEALRYEKEYRFVDPSR